MLISVVVCTRNRLESLRRCIQAFKAIKTEHEWELIIVDNGSSDGTDAFLSSLPVRINNGQIRATFEPKRGLAAARNKGIKQATGEIIAFTDDDCYVAEDYIDAVLMAFANSDVSFAGGRVLLHDPTDLPITIREGQERLTLMPNTFLSPAAIQGANMAFRKSTLNLIGGFDECFGAGTGIAAEDTVALAAAMWSGASGIYDPKIVVYHHHGRKTRDVARALWKTYDKGIGAYFAKFILRPDSRSAYLRAWLDIFIRNLVEARLNIKSYFVLVRQLIRQLDGALLYIISLRTRPRGQNH
jgi:glycosyltransferase involved in cell wall biosynthesis